jgi:N-acetylglutamate synthase-like GNAT family acetyltransferase
MIRPARADEAEALTQLARRSNASWGYDDEFIELSAPELVVTSDEIQSLVVRVAEREGRIVGFSALDADAVPPELVALFVEPTAVRTGVGRALLEHAMDQALALGIEQMVVESDPNAEDFYLAHGAQRVGMRRSASTGRSLPLLGLQTRRRHGLETLARRK